MVDTLLNKVNLPAVGELVGSIQQDASNAQTIWQATVDWKGGFKSEATIRDFPPLHSDEPLGLGGEDTAPNPVEQLLAALGNCLAVGYAANATVADIELKSLRVELEGDIDLRTFLGLDDGHAGYETITAKVSIESEASPERIEELHRKVVSSSPVGHSLSRAISVSVDLAGR